MKKLLYRKIPQSTYSALNKIYAAGKSPYSRINYTKSNPEWLRLAEKYYLKGRKTK